MKRALGTFAVTAAVVALIIAGLAYTWVGGATVAIIIFGLMWGMTDAIFGDLFER